MYETIDMNRRPTSARVFSNDAGSRGPVRVLALVGDRKEFAAMERGLREAGFEVDPVTSCADVLRAGDADYHAFLLDLRMHGEGERVLEYLANYRRHTLRKAVILLPEEASLVTTLANAYAFGVVRNSVAFEEVAALLRACVLRQVPPRIVRC
ncbi:MAG TPA: hypothetical protein VNL91_11670 [Thermoanaerobaculia bacterium]|nr:hypothetical protein [Thermoanaerobaculia bacterium]